MIYIISNIVAVVLVMYIMFRVSEHDEIREYNEACPAGEDKTIGGWWGTLVSSVLFTLIIVLLSFAIGWLFQQAKEKHDSYYATQSQLEEVREECCDKIPCVENGHKWEFTEYVGRSYIFKCGLCESSKKIYGWDMTNKWFDLLEKQTGSIEREKWMDPNRRDSISIDFDGESWDYISVLTGADHD